MAMEHTKTIRKIVYILILILLSQLGVLAYVFFPGDMMFWTTLTVILVVGLYLAIIGLKLIKLLNKEDNNQ